MTQRQKILEIAGVFFRLGCIAFGGPAAHIAMMEDEIVTKRKWITREHFLDLIGATNLIPGPNSTEMTMHCGYERAGTAGLFVAGACFIFPAVVITGFFAWLYVEFGSLPQVEPFIMGIKPIVLAIIAGAILKLGKKALKNTELGVLGLMVLIASILGMNEIFALLVAGILGALYFRIRDGLTFNNSTIWPLLFFQTAAKTLLPYTTWSIFWTFLKVGAVLYGSGYVLFAYLDAELVTRGWLTRQELIDAVAVGQFTPGPVLSTSTFIGYQLDGFSGAIAATLGIFLPSFLFVLVLNPLVPRMRQSKILAAFLDAVNIAAVAVMLSVLYEMGKDVLLDWKSILICLVGAVLTFGPKKINMAWIVLLGGLLGYFMSLL